MFADIKDTVKKTSIYSLGNISTKLVGFLLLPLYTDYLTTSEFGDLAILQAILQIFIGLFSLNLPTAMLRWAASQKDKKKEHSIIFTTFLSTVIIAVGVVILFIPFSEQFSIQVFKSLSFTSYFDYLFLAASLGIISNVPLNIIRLKELPTFFVVLTTIKFIIIIAFNIYFVTVLNIGVKGIIISELIGHLFVVVFTLPFVIKNSYPSFELRILREMMKYGLPLIFTTFFTFALTLSDRFIIKYFVDDSSVGIYSLGHKIASVMNMFVLQSFQLGFLPIAYKKLGEPNDKRFFSKILTYYTLILVFVAFVLSLFSKELIEVLAQNKEYWEAYIVIPIISLAFVLKGIQYNFALSFHYSKRTTYNAFIVILTAVINIALNIVLVQMFGFIGSAYAFVISIFFMMLLSYYFGQKVFHIPYEISKITKIVFLGIILFALSFLVSEMSIFIRIVSKIILLFLFGVIVLFVNIFDEIEIQSLKRGIADFKNLIFKRLK